MKALAICALALFLIATPLRLRESPLSPPKTEPVAARPSAPMLREPLLPETAPKSAPVAAPALAPEEEPTIADLMRTLPPASTAPRLNERRARSRDSSQSAQSRASGRGAQPNAPLAVANPVLESPEDSEESGPIVAAAPTAKPHCEPYTIHDAYIESEQAVVRGTACRDADGRWWLVNRVRE